MSRCLMVLMLPHVGSELRVDNPAQRHKPKREPCDSTLFYSTGHNL